MAAPNFASMNDEQLAAESVSILKELAARAGIPWASLLAFLFTNKDDIIRLLQELVAVFKVPTP